MPLLAIGAEKSFSAMNKSELAFVYAYAPDCSYCEKFKPNYEKLVQKYGKIFAFSKVDVTTKEGAVYAKEKTNKNNIKKHLVFPSAFCYYGCALRCRSKRIGRLRAEIVEFSPKVYSVLREGKVADKKQKAFFKEEKPWLFNLKQQKITIANPTEAQIEPCGTS